MSEPKTDLCRWCNKVRDFNHTFTAGYCLDNDGSVIYEHRFEVTPPSPQQENTRLFCEVCGYPVHLADRAEMRYGHTLPEGRKYSTQKAEFPECWNNARVEPKPAQTFRSDEVLLREILSYNRRRSDNHPKFDIAIREACIKLQGFDPDEIHAAKGTR